MFPGADQDTFVSNTERDALLLNTAVTSSWEVAGNWIHALSEYFPRFAERGIIRAAAGVNVPFMVPVLAFGQEFFRVFESKESGNKSTTFRPNEWRGTRQQNPETLNVTDMAQRINNYPLGTVSPIYITSDGGVRQFMATKMQQVRSCS